MNAPLRVPTSTRTPLMITSWAGIRRRSTASAATWSSETPGGRSNPAAPPSFVPRGAVQPGDGDVVQAVIDAEDRPVVDQVVEDEAADHHRPRHGDQRLSPLEQGP